MHCRSDEAIDAASAVVARKPRGLLTTASDELVEKPILGGWPRQARPQVFKPPRARAGKWVQQPPHARGGPTLAPGHR
jgi:hypothetical protein